MPQQLPIVEGWMGFILTFASLVGVLLTAVYWAVKKPLEVQLNGLGTRVNSVENIANNNTARVNRLEGDMRESSQDRQNLAKQLGELEGGVRSLERGNHDMKLEIVNLINTRFSESNEQLHKVELQFAVLQGQILERERQRSLRSDAEEQLRNRG